MIFEISPSRQNPDSDGRREPRINTEKHRTSKIEIGKLKFLSHQMPPSDGSLYSLSVLLRVYPWWVFYFKLCVLVRLCGELFGCGSAALKRYALN